MLHFNIAALIYLWIIATPFFFLSNEKALASRIAATVIRLTFYFIFVEREGACQRNRCHSHPVDVSFILSNEKALVGGFAAVVFRLTFYFAILGLWYMQVDMLIYC